MTLRRPTLALLALLGILALATLARAEIAQHGDLRVTYTASLRPRALPRTAPVPVTVSLGGRIATTDGATPPQLRRISIAINANGRLHTAGLPTCTLSQIQPATTAGALAACSGALVGQGTFSSRVLFPASAPFPSKGRVYAFNGVIGCSPSERHLRSLLGSEAGGSQPVTDNAHARGPINSLSRAGRLWPSRSRTQGGRQGERTPVRDPQAADRGRRAAPCHSRPAILAHIYGTEPAPTSSTIPFTISLTHGTYGTLLRAFLPHVTSRWGYVTGLRLNLGRTYRYRGARRSYLSAACPAPPGIGIVSFPLARATYAFAGGRSLSRTLTRSCRVRG
jgi:hypothetical protein